MGCFALLEGCYLLLVTKKRLHGSVCGAYAVLNFQGLVAANVLAVSLPCCHCSQILMITCCLSKIFPSWMEYWEIFSVVIYFSLQGGRSMALLVASSFPSHSRPTARYDAPPIARVGPWLNEGIGECFHCFCERGNSVGFLLLLGSSDSASQAKMFLQGTDFQLPGADALLQTIGCTEDAPRISCSICTTSQTVVQACSTHQLSCRVSCRNFSELIGFLSRTNWSANPHAGSARLTPLCSVQASSAEKRYKRMMQGEEF